MGNAGCKGINNSNKASHLINKTNNPISNAIKTFINSPSNPTKVEEKKPSAISSIDRRSNINKLMNGGEILTLSQDILSCFSNAEIAKVNNENVYISVLLPNFFEQQPSESRLNSSHNVNVSSVQNNWPLYFTTNTIDKINEIFNLTNDTSEKTNRYKMSMHSVNSTYRDILGLSIHNLNMSRDSILESEPNNTISRMNTKKSRLTTVFSKRSSKEVAITEEDETSFNFTKPKKGSSKSVKFVNIQTDNSQYKRRASLNPVKEFEVDLPEREDYEDSSEKSFRSEINKKKMKKTTNRVFPTKRRNISDSRNAKKISYSVALRKKVQSAAHLNNLKKIESTRAASRSPFDLFSDKVLEHFKNEENVVEHTSKKTVQSNAVNPITNNYVMKQPNLMNKKQKKSKKQNLHFSINLKVIIKQELKENLNSNGRVNHNHVNNYNYNNYNSENPYSNHFTNLKKRENFNMNSINNSTLFKDSIDKYVHFENSLFNTAAQKGQSISSKKNKRGFYTSAAKLNSQKNNTDKITPSIDMLSKISISNFEEKDNIQNSNFQDNSEETINKDIELLKK